MFRCLLDHFDSSPSRPRHQSFRLRVERLEDRALLSVAGHGHGNSDREITVLTRNLYVGADLGPVTTALGTGDPNQFIPAIGAAWNMIRNNDFPARAEALAEEIEETQPLLVGLQEVSLLQTGAFFNPAPADHVEYDYLEILLDALEARGLDYSPVAVLNNIDAEFPGMTHEGLRDVRVTDRDVILARTDLPASQLKIENVETHHFATLGAIELPGPDFPFLRGWASVDAKVRGKAFRFVNTHLEPAVDADSRAIQEAQALELLAGPGNTSQPVIFAGDYNSEADPTGTIQQTDSYDHILAAGFSDLWNVENPDEVGNTHGFGDAPEFPGDTLAGDLHDPDPTLEQRIDFIFYRGGWEAEDVDILGESLADRTPSGLWPSDHAGVVGTLNLDVRRAHHGRFAPLIGHFSGQTVSGTPTADPNVVFVVTDGTGWATQLGAFTMTSPHYSHLDTLEADGTQIITAAKGDTLTANFQGRFTPTADGKLLGVLRAKIVGGTGRFADASGSYVFTILFDPATFESSAWIVGGISY